MKPTDWDLVDAINDAEAVVTDKTPGRKPLFWGSVSYRGGSYHWSAQNRDVDIAEPLPAGIYGVFAARVMAAIADYERNEGKATSHQEVRYVAVG